MKRIIKLTAVVITFFSFSLLATSSLNYKLPQYIISDYDGKIAVYKYGYDSPSKIYDVYTSSFSGDEQAEILEGKEIYSEKELHELLEAYLS